MCVCVQISVMVHGLRGIWGLLYVGFLAKEEVGAAVSVLGMLHIWLVWMWGLAKSEFLCVQIPGKKIRKLVLRSRGRSRSRSC